METQTNYLSLPQKINSEFEIHDVDQAVRPIITKVGDTWTKHYRKSLISLPQTQTLSTDDLTKEKNKAFDLIDALSRSGSLDFDSGCQVHIFNAVCHSFDKTVLETLIQNNINPIQKLEGTMTLLSQIIHQNNSL